MQVLRQADDNAGKGLPAVDAEYADCHGNSQLKVVAGSRKGYRGAFRIICPEVLSSKEAYHKHNREIYDQRDSYPYYIHGYLHNQFAFQAEHDHDSKQ